MKNYPLITFALALTLLFFTCIFSSCQKNSFAPNTSTKKTTGVTDSTTAALDTLPSFNSPSGIAIDPAGNLYVADYGNNVIRKITATGLVSTFAGSGTQGSVNATGILATFDEPTGLALDASGNIYVADAGNSLIRKVTAAGVVTTFAGSDTTGSVNGPALSSSFFDPAGVAVDASGNVYVADAGNNLIRLITAAGTVSTLAGAASTITSNGTLAPSSFNNPTGVAVDQHGNVFAANYLNNNILEVTAAGTVFTLAGSGQTGAQNGADSAATFFYPNSVAVDAAGNVYVSDGVNNLIRKISPAGTVSTLAGSGAAGAADGTGTAASFNGPAGLVTDAKGNVYVADANNNMVRKITPAGVVTTIAGTGEPGIKNGQAIARRSNLLAGRVLKTRFNIWNKRLIRRF